jgi:predicted PurR-regulated permease PerM
MLIALLIAIGLAILLGSQFRHLIHAWPRLMDKLQDMTIQLVAWFSDCFHISTFKVNVWLANAKDELAKNGNAAIGMTLISAGGILQATILTPVYIFMILIYQPHLLAFSHRLFGTANDEKVSEILTETKSIVKSYIVGLFGEFVIIATLNSIGLLALGIEYAILLGILGAALNVIPIIGGIICILLFVIIALVTKSAIYVLYVIGLYAVIQFIDDHYIFPKIVGSKVKLNLLVSIIAVILGDALWGIPGMFLAIPLVAIVKVFLDRIESLKPWGFLLGDTIPEHESMKFTFVIKGFMQHLTQKKQNKP